MKFNQTSREVSEIYPLYIKAVWPHFNIKEKICIAFSKIGKVYNFTNYKRCS